MTRYVRVMGARNGQSVFDIVADSWHRKVTTTNGKTPAVSLPPEWLEERDIELGDDVVIKPGGGDDPKLELHFGR